MKSFTLVETLIVIFVFVLLMGVIAFTTVFFYKTYKYTLDQAKAITEARRGVQIMVKEIREARPGDDGSFPIEKAGDKEFIFYSDIDKDGDVERVRYFLGNVISGNRTEKCVTFIKGGSCSVNFSDFLSGGTLKSASVKVSVEGDFGWSLEYADIYADGRYLGRICEHGCSDCAGEWQGTKTFDVTEDALDGSIQFLADASSRVDPLWHCDWEEENHSMKVKFEFSWEEEQDTGAGELKKGVIDPTPPPVEYPEDQEKVSIISSYVRNNPPIFEYYDEDGKKIEDYPARLSDTKVMKIFLVINVDPKRKPDNFELESWVQIRNLKEKSF